MGLGLGLGSGSGLGSGLGSGVVVGDDTTSCASSRAVSKGLASKVWAGRSGLLKTGLGATAPGVEWGAGPSRGVGAEGMI